MTREELERVEAIIRETARRIPGNGPAGRIDRFSSLLPELFKIKNGNIIEIGAGHGDATLVFKNAVAGYERKVLVIDPYDDEFNGKKNVYTYENFCRVVSMPCNEVELLRIRSDSAEAWFMSQRMMPIYFSFVDGDQFTTGAVLRDISMVSDADSEIICIDDIQRKLVSDEIKEFLNTPKGKEKYCQINLGELAMETYLLRRD